MLDSNTIKAIIDTLLPFSPQKIILFGSYAYGSPKANSDIDIMVVKDIKKENVKKTRLRIKKKLWESFNSQNLYFDVIVDSEERICERIEIGDLFYQEIYNKGQLIYA